MSRLIRPIEDPDEISSVRRLVSDLIVAPDDFNPEWLRQRNWATIPVDCETLMPDEASRLAEALAALGCRECVAVATDPDITEHVCPAYRVVPTATGLHEANWEYAGLNHIILARERTSAVLFDEEYKLYAGPRGFVERAIGCSIAVARKDFLEVYATASPGLESLKELYEQVSKRYESFNGD